MTPQWGDGSWRGRAIERACGKWKRGGEKSARLSAGGVEFDSERGKGEGRRGRKGVGGGGVCGEGCGCQRGRAISTFQRISLSQPLTHYIHSSLSAGP